MPVVYSLHPVCYCDKPSALKSVWVLDDWELDEHVRIIKRAAMRGLLATSESRLLRRQWNLAPRDAA